MSEIFQQAQTLIPGGVNSPVRSPASLGLKSPLYFTHANGAIIYDHDQPYIDYQNGFGTEILGHNHPHIKAAIQASKDKSLPAGICHQGEITLARLIQQACPAAEKIRFCVSGTESCMTALRLAQHHTKRSGFVTIDGGYHGHSEPYLSNPLHMKVPFNDIEALATCLHNHPSCAALVIEPIPGNMGMIKPHPKYLKQVRRLCDEAGVCLIADEVMTGFRCQYGTVIEAHGVVPDLICLAKVIGGGLPLACVAGKKEIMDTLSPIGPVAHAGTYASLTTCIDAGCAALSYLTDHHYDQMNAYTKELTHSLEEIASAAGIPLTTNHQGGMWSLFFSERPITKRSDIPSSHNTFFQAFYPLMLAEGIFLPPASAESFFITTSHQDVHLQHTLQAAEKAFKEIAKTMPANTH